MLEQMIQSRIVIEEINILFSVSIIRLGIFAASFRLSPLENSLVPRYVPRFLMQCGTKAPNRGTVPYRPLRTARYCTLRTLGKRAR
jgi:hypothetical protein